MKLLFCVVCWDIFKLAEKERSCECGMVTGRYLDDGHNAVTNGKGISLALGNGSLSSAIAKMQELKNFIPEANKKSYIEHARIHYAWVRPNEGPGNPRQKVVKDEQDNN